MPTQDFINKVTQGDCMEVLKQLEDNSIDSCITDPPYELGFMGKKWDATGIANNVEMWKEVLRVLKPGGHLLAFGGSRTYHRMACAIEDAGFEIRDTIMWVYGSGFPKSLDISKSIDKQAGAERKILGIYEHPQRQNRTRQPTGEFKVESGNPRLKEEPNYLTEPATEQAKEWRGWGTALKPSVEPIVVARKPLSEKNVALNVLKWGTGGINIDECRIGTDVIKNAPPSYRGKTGEFVNQNRNFTKGKIEYNIGRFPANLILDEEAGKILDEQSGISKSSQNILNHGWSADGSNDGWKREAHKKEFQRVAGFDDMGGASRFFYCAKASKSERNNGCEELPLQRAGGMQGRNDGSFDGKITYNNNNHPTVKPIKLMRYLIKLITSKKGLVLDPFTGSGTTLIGCVKEGFNYVGIEKEEEYCKIAESRIRYHEGLAYYEPTD